jgi:chemotaxis protein MotB
LQQNLDGLKIAIATATAARDSAAAALQEMQAKSDEAAQALAKASDDLKARQNELESMQAKQQEATQALADSQAKLAAAQQAQQQAEGAAQQAKDASAEAEKKLADTRSQLDDQTKQVSETSQKLASLGQQTLEADKAKTDAAAAREEAQKQLAQTQAELGTAIKADAVPHLRNTVLAQIRQSVGAKPGVQVADDRLVIANDSLFPAGSATLSPAGRNLLTQIAAALKDVTAQQAPDTDWLIRVDGHADKQPAGGRYPSNWDLSAARAVIVVRSLVGAGVPANRVAAETFGENQPLDPADTPSAYAKNRRIEIRLTER